MSSAIALGVSSVATDPYALFTGGEESLREICRSYGLPPEGGKQNLIYRLTSREIAYSDAVSEYSSEESGSEDEEGEEEEDEDAGEEDEDGEGEHDV